MVRSAGSKQRGYFVGIGKARFGPVVEELDLRIQTSKVLVHYELHLLVQCDLLLRQLIGSRIVLADLGAKEFLLRVGLMAPVRLDPFLYLPVAVLDNANALIVLAVLVGDLLLDETNLLGEVLDTIDPVVEDQAGVEGLGLRHPLDEVDRQVVSRHDC